jgi:hypothetical protein
VEFSFRETNNMSMIRIIGLAVVASFAVIIAASIPAAAQQQPNQQVSEARRAAIQKCVQQAHQEVQGEGTSQVQQRYLVYVNCMTAAGVQP